MPPGLSTARRHATVTAWPRAICRHGVVLSGGGGRPGMLTLLLISLAAGPPVTVQGDSLCPAPAEVAPRLTALLRANAAAAAPDVALLGDQGGALSIRLQRPDGSLIGERTLERL